MTQENEAAAAPNESGSEEQKLPPLSLKDFGVYNRMAAQMDGFVCSSCLFMATKVLLE